MTSRPNCRFCEEPLRHTFVDLGMSPLSNAYLRGDQLNRMEPFYPLHARVCSKCFLVQLEEFEKPENIFSGYAYFSSYSESWLRHSREYAEHATKRFHLNKHSLVVEIGSNDGYLLQYFLTNGVPVLGVEPAQNVADVARIRGVPTVARFFGRGTATELAAEERCADLIVANNVLAHVPDLNGFVQGLQLLLKPQGIVTVEFPHLLRLIEGGQFDTIYHEHFSYISFCTAEELFHKHGLRIFDVDELPTHGGSLRLYVAHADNETVPQSTSVAQLRRQEITAGIRDLSKYAGFAEKYASRKGRSCNFWSRPRTVGKAWLAMAPPRRRIPCLTIAESARTLWITP